MHRLSPASDLPTYTGPRCRKQPKRGDIPPGTAAVSACGGDVGGRMLYFARSSRLVRQRDGKRRFRSLSSSWFCLCRRLPLSSLQLFKLLQRPLASLQRPPPPPPPCLRPASSSATTGRTRLRACRSRTARPSRSCCGRCSTRSRPSSRPPSRACAAPAPRRCVSTRPRPRSRASAARSGAWHACLRAAATTTGSSCGWTGSRPARTRSTPSSGATRATTTSAWSRCVPWVGLLPLFAETIHH